MSEEINFIEKYEKLKNDTTPSGRLRFAVLYVLPESPYFNPTRHDELVKKLAETEPLANYYLFRIKLIGKNYIEAFEYFKLWSPYLFGRGVKYPENKELQEWIFLQKYSYYEEYIEEVRYLDQKTTDSNGECTQCAEDKFRHCVHYQLNQNDMICLNILRFSKKTFECPICYEKKLYIDKCGDICFKRHGYVCHKCVPRYEHNKFIARSKCAICKNIWCKSCSIYIRRCPFCRIVL